MLVRDLIYTLGVQFFFQRLTEIPVSVTFTIQIGFKQFPIINSTHHLLPSPNGELAPAIEAILDIYGTEVTVVVSHNGQGAYLNLFFFHHDTNVGGWM
jgi:hypothetical protein